MGAAHFKAFAAADFFFEGDDAGTGIFTQGPPRFIGGTNVDTGSSGGFVEVVGPTSGRSYQALDYAGPSGARSEDAGPTPPTRCRTTPSSVTPADNAGARRVGPGARDSARRGATQVLRARRPQRRAVGAAAQPDERRRRARASRSPSRRRRPTATARRTPARRCATRSPARTPTAGAATLDADGRRRRDRSRARTRAPTRSSVFVDFNNDGVRQAVEPQASALATFVDSVPPTCTRQGQRRPWPGGSGVGQAARRSRSTAARARPSPSPTTLQPRSRRRAPRASPRPRRRSKKVKTIKLKTKHRSPSRAGRRRSGVAEDPQVASRKQVRRQDADGDDDDHGRATPRATSRRPRSSARSSWRKLKKSKAHKKR